MSRPPIGEAAGKREQVEAMFDAIAPRYDLLNRVLSFGIDQLWRRAAIRLVGEGQPRRILDVATGTADLALHALHLNPDEVVGVDISEEMLRHGRQKVAAVGEAGRVTLMTGDAAALPFEDDTFDAALVAFGVRNFENLGAGLEEIRRVLRPGGALVVLEFSQPHVSPVKELYAFYSRYILPLVGRLVSGDSGAYTYLPDSIAAFPSGPAFLRAMDEAGYRDLLWRPLTFGIASLYRGVNP